jgi:predicted NUDIX family NTP pyrophosphohydrolase
MEHALAFAARAQTMAKRSAGILMYQRMSDGLQVLLVHPGGPFWATKDLGAWSIPKGEHEETDEPLAVAIREFAEETGLTPRGSFHPLGTVKQAGGKTATAFALEGTFDPQTLVSNTFEMEWPPRSGKRRSVPEVDRAAWFTLDEARRRILPSQTPFLDQLAMIAA